MAYRYLMEGRKRTNVKRFSISNLFIAILLICSTAFINRSAPASKLEQVITAGELRVLARSGPISHYQGAEGTTGFEYTLLKGFADELGVKLVLTETEQFSNLLQSSSLIDLASPSVISSQISKDQLRFSSAFLQFNLQLVFNSSQNAPANIDALAGKKVLYVNKASVPVSMQELQQSLPGIQWELVDNIEMTDLLEMVERGTADYAIVDSAVFDLHRYSYPHTQVAFNIDAPGTARDLAWAFAKSRDTSLYDAAQKYLAKIKSNGTLAQVSTHFFDQFIEVNTDDALMFSERVEKRFPRWEDSIKAAATVYNLDWQLVAAIGYQESQWIPNAQSPTGVRGFMMLTPETARELGVKNLDDPKQSINGGAKYMRYLMDTLPESIKGEDLSLIHI